MVVNLVSMTTTNAVTAGGAPLALPRLIRRPFTMADAQRAGVRIAEVRRLLAAGVVRRVLLGVYLDSSVPHSVEIRCQALRISLPERPSVICDRTAAWLHGVDCFSIAELEWVPRVECVVPVDGSRVRREHCSGRRRGLLPRDIQELHGLQVTTPLRTALDLARMLRSRSALAATDGLMRECGVTNAQMKAELGRFKGFRGVIQLRSIADLASPLAESAGESWTRMVLIEAGLPRPTLQHWVYEDGLPVYRLDLAYVKAKVAVEFDGVDFHTSPEQRLADERRRAWLRARGWTVIVVTRESFTATAINAWTSEVREALRPRPGYRWR